MKKCLLKRKLRIKEEVAVMDVAYVSSNTRKQALSTAAAESSGPAKRRNVGGGDTEFSSSSSSSSSVAEFNRHRQVTENSVSIECLTDSEDQHSSLNSDHVSALSNASMKLLASTDLEEKSVEIENLTCDFDCKESKATTPLCERREDLDKLESTAKQSCHRQSPAAKTPSQAEVEEFFAAAEKMVQKEFADKYNFDVVNDKPLEGRYEWVRLKK